MPYQFHCFECDVLAVDDSNIIDGEDICVSTVSCLVEMGNLIAPKRYLVFGEIFGYRVLLDRTQNL